MVISSSTPRNQQNWDELFETPGLQIPKDDEQWNGPKCISVLHVGDFGFLNIRELMQYHPKYPGQPCSPGDLLFSKINPRIPRVLIVPNLPVELTCSTEFEVLRAKPDLSPFKLALLLLSSFAQNQILSLTSGTSSSHNRIKTAQLLEIRLPFPPSAIIKRKPLAPTARRHGWVGCNFDSSRIPTEARIEVVRTMAPQRRSGVAPDSDSKPREYGDRRDACPTIIIPPSEVREKFKRVKPLKEIGVKERGWTLDVLNVVRRLVEERSRWGEATDEPAREDARPTNTFTTSDVYAFTRELEKLHPENSEGFREQAAMSVTKSASNFKSSAMPDFNS